MKKKAIAAIIAAACLITPATINLSKDKPIEKKTINYEYLTKNRKFLRKVDYKTFRSNLDSGQAIIKMPEQEKFLEEIVYALNNGREYNSDRKVDRKEFTEFIFDYVLEEKLGYEIKTPTDVIVGINMALEYLADYNMKMPMAHPGLGSDINDDGRFDGINWTYLQKAGWNARKESLKNPKKGIAIARKESDRVDNAAKDALLISGDGEPNAVKIVCRNYTPALKILLDTAKEKYPQLTKNIEFVHMPEPGHVFVAFINKKALQYIVVDPTWHDSSGKEFDLNTLVFPPGKDPHYDCLQDPNFFEILKFEEKLNNYRNVRRKEIIFHNDSKKIIEDLLPQVQELAKKYPESATVTNLEIMTYANFGNNKENYKKSFELLKGIYDNKERKEKLDMHEHSILLICLGELASELKYYEQSIKFFKECSKYAVALSYFADDAMIELADVNLKAKNYYEALFRAKDVLELCPEHHKEAGKVIGKAMYNLWFVEKKLGEEVKNILPHYIKGDYDKVLKKLEGNDLESKLFLAKTHATLNHYDEAKTIYKDIIQENDKTFSKIAESALNQMNRKFFLYGYAHHFDNKFEQSIKEFEFLKSRITPKDGVSEHLSLLLMLSYWSTEDLKNAISEADSFLKNFPEDSKYYKYVKQILKELQEQMAQQENN